MFMHNGFIGSWSRLRRKVEAMIPDPLFPSRTGTTDSEAIFLAMMGASLDQDPVEATRRVLRLLCKYVNEDGHQEQLRFTAALANGHDLFAFRFAENDNANTLFFRQKGDQLILVSEPFDKRPDWEEVPTNHAVIALSSRPVEIVPLMTAVSEQLKQEQLQISKVSARAQ
jgi:glutamine amidotransferase